MQDSETINESQDTYPNAGRASGYKDESGNDIGENIINKVTELMVAPQTKLVQLTARMDAAHTLQEQRFDYVLRQLQAHFDKEDQRHAVIDASDKTTLDALTSVAHRLDEITSYVQQSVTIAREALTVSKDGAARLGKITKDVMILKKAMVDSQIDRADLRQRIDAMSMSQAVFAASMLLSAHAVIVIDPQQVIASVNHKALAYFGYTDGELIGQPLDMLIPERFRKAHRAHIRAFAQSSDTERLMSDRHTVYGLHKDGSEFPIRAAIVKVSNGFTAVVERVDDAQ